MNVEYVHVHHSVKYSAAECCGVCTNRFLLFYNLTTCVVVDVPLTTCVVVVVPLTTCVVVVVSLTTCVVPLTTSTVCTWNHFVAQMSKVGLKIRAAVMTEVYRKALSVSSTTLSKFSTGEVGREKHADTIVMNCSIEGVNDSI